MSTLPNLPIYGTPEACSHPPKNTFPEDTVAAAVVKRMLEDELTLDGVPAQNLASFVTTWMEPEAEELMMRGMKKNFIDFDEYAKTCEMHNRCVNMLADLFHAPRKEDESGIGTGTIGSSEAIMLAGLAMKWRWRNIRKEKNLSYDKPNIIFGSNVQVVWHKMAKYFDIEMREAPVSPDCLILTAERAKSLIDENTIGVCPILGSTYNGEYEDVKAIHDMIAEVNEKNGWQIPIHVDAASGGFIAPFINPELLWDFRLPWVKSINVSGHKFGLVYAGIGWCMFREKIDLPEDLIFHVNYLGGDQASFTLNFSKGASQIIGQYYQFCRLGRTGYKAIMSNGMQIAGYLRDNLLETGYFDQVDKAQMPLVALALKSDVKFCSVFDLQDRLHDHGWIIPAYNCPPGAETLAILRIVVKQNFSMVMADMLIEDFKVAFAYFKKHPVRTDLTEHTPKLLTKTSKWHLARDAIIGSNHLKICQRNRKEGTVTKGVC